MIQIELQPEIEAQLAAEARAYGIELERYVERIVSSRRVEAVDNRAAAEAIDAIRQLRMGNRLGDAEIQELIREGRKY